MKLENSASVAGILTAIASSLCCITPVVAFFAGTSSLASTFSWIEPARPYLLGMTVLALSFAWYLKWRPLKADNCGCEIAPKRSFLQTKSFLLGVTLFAVIASAFPLYAGIFFPKTENAVIVTKPSQVKKVEFSVEGMTCVSCENHVKAEISKLPGIVDVAVSYEKGTAIAQFDDKQTSATDIQKAIDATGYSVIQQKNLTQ